MADLGAIGTVMFRPVNWSLGREAFVLDRVGRYPALAALVTDLDLCASLETDFKALGGSVRASGGAGVAREVRILHRGSGRLVARGRSEAGSGAFLIQVPPGLRVDLHILAEAGDGCDLYLPDRTPVDV